nr:MAG TPA: hypothetical protein [Caudoviricetes sp.]
MFVNYVNHFTISRISPLNAHRQCYGEVLTLEQGA